MVWQQMMAGILLGIVGIVMLLFLIPMFFGLKKLKNKLFETHW